MKKSEKKDVISKDITTSTAYDIDENVKKLNTYYFKTPQEVLEKYKVFYIVRYHQISFNHSLPSFPDEQFMEFADLNPIEARRQAFKFAKSYNTKPSEYEELKNRNPLPVDDPNIPNARWCYISCIEHGESQQRMVYNEGQNELSPLFLEGLGDELELYRKYGYTNGYEVIKITDEEGNSHEVIAEENGFSS